MDFSAFFAQQARKPSGWFGRWIMTRIFDIGNARLNRFVYDILSPHAGDHILETGCGTGKLIKKIAGGTAGCTVEGVDFSDTMVSIALRNNKRHIAAGRAIIRKGNFDDMLFHTEPYTKICSVNTIYFWSRPEYTARKMISLLKPFGMAVVGYEDKAQLDKRSLDKSVFRLYSKSEVGTLFSSACSSLDVTTKSICIGTAVFNCTVATKKSDKGKRER